MFLRRRDGVRTFHIAVADKVTLTNIVTDNITRGAPLGLFGNIGLMGSPFVIVEIVAHDPRRRVGSLNHELGDIINPQRPIAVNDNPLILLPLSALQPTWRNLLLASSPVENDPSRHFAATW